MSKCMYFTLSSNIKARQRQNMVKEAKGYQLKKALFFFFAMNAYKPMQCFDSPL